MFASDTKAYFFLECDEKGEYIGLGEVWEIEEPSLERMDGVQQLALQGDREERYFATLTLLEWMEPIGLDACEKMLESKILDEGRPLAPHRLWGKDCAYEELAYRVVRRFGPWEKHELLIKRFLSPDIYGNYHNVISP
ncbi:hypothetical protein [Paludifilum halophilum]|uniref:Uncharacterized protein n=1 Tax=Paludifilum halophilum TaxID=1642702 RepID=A0A235B4W3_9BACL|nr:hypothetical protein [Paludifilum halophilum]OYD07334.1 hypothetical protein CHM34_10485 [Paludifilum halophilum]